MAIDKLQDEFIDPLSLVDAGIGGNTVDPFLASVAPGLMEQSDSSFASKELNVGREAVTGGRAFRNPVIRSKTVEDQAREAMALNRGYGLTFMRGMGVPVGDRSGATQKDAIAAGRASQMAKEFGLGIGAGAVKNIGLTGILGTRMGLSPGEIAGAMPGAVAGAVKSGIQGPLGTAAEMLGAPSSIAGPLGAVNTLGGLAGTQLATDIAERRATDVPSAITGFADTGIVGGIRDRSRAAAEKAAAPPRGTGLIGMLSEGLASFLGDFKSPIEQAQEAIREAEFNAAQVERGRLPGDIYGTDMPGLTSQLSGILGNALASALEAAGGFGSLAEAEEAGFTYNRDPRTGQISIEPPSMNLGGLDDNDNDNDGVGVGAANGGGGYGDSSAGGSGVGAGHGAGGSGAGAGGIGGSAAGSGAGEGHY